MDGREVGVVGRVRAGEGWFEASEWQVGLYWIRVDVDCITIISPLEKAAIIAGSEKSIQNDENETTVHNRRIRTYA